MVPLKNLCNFWINFEMPLLNCEVNLILTWSAKCVLSNSGNQEKTLAVNSRYKTLCSGCSFINLS